MKIKKDKILYSLDLKRIEYDGPCDLPLYTVTFDGVKFDVKYYDSCIIYSTYSFEDAKLYIRESLEKANQMIRNAATSS